MFQFTGFPSHILFDSYVDDRSLSCRVSPFRYPWIFTYLQLPKAFRSLSRLSSALSAKASTLRSLCMTFGQYHSVGILFRLLLYKVFCLFSDVLNLLFKNLNFRDNSLSRRVNIVLAVLNIWDLRYLSSQKNIYYMWFSRYILGLNSHLKTKSLLFSNHCLRGDFI